MRTSTVRKAHDEDGRPNGARRPAIFARHRPFVSISLAVPWFPCCAPDTPVVLVMAEERQSGSQESDIGETPHRDGHLRSALAASVCAALSLSAAVQALRLWEWRPGSPLELGGDATFFTVQIDELLHTGPQSASKRLGAPFGQNSGWFPSDDHLHFAIVKLLSIFSDSPFTVAALYFIIGFPASALTAYWLMRQVGAGRVAAVTGSVLFSVLPGHQEKFEHIWLAAYWVLPLGIWLVVTVGLDRPLFRRADRRGDWPARLRSMWPNAETALIVLALGTGGVYYLAFTLILLAAVLILRFAMGARRELLVPMAAAGSMLAIAATAIAHSSRGRGADLVTGATPAGRSPSESEFFAGKPLDLVLPWYEHRVAAMRFITQAYNLGPRLHGRAPGARRRCTGRRHRPAMGGIPSPDAWTT